MQAPSYAKLWILASSGRSGTFAVRGAGCGRHEGSLPAGEMLQKQARMICRTCWQPNMSWKSSRKECGWSADSSHVAKKNQRRVDRQAPQCDEAAGRGRRMGFEQKSTTLVGRDVKKYCVMEGSQKPESGNTGQTRRRRTGHCKEVSRRILSTETHGGKATCQ